MFVDCPACLVDEGAIRCGLSGEVRCRFTIRSSDGPLEAAVIRCPSGHWFNGPIESLTCDSKDKHDPRAVAAVADASRGGSPAGRGGRGGSAVQYSSPEPDQHIHPSERRSCLLSGAARLPVPHRHKPALQGQHTQRPDECPDRRPGADAIAVQRPLPRRGQRSPGESASATDEPILRGINGQSKKRPDAQIGGSLLAWQLSLVRSF